MQSKTTMVHEQLNTFFNGFRSAHPMAIMVAVVAALSAFYPDSINISDIRLKEGFSARRMVAKIPTLAAMAFKYSLGQPFVYPDNSLNYSENFMKMCFAVPAEPYKINKTFAKALIFFNNFTCRSRTKCIYINSKTCRIFRC